MSISKHVIKLQDDTVTNMRHPSILTSQASQMCVNWSRGKNKLCTLYIRGQSIWMESFYNDGGETVKQDFFCNIVIFPFVFPQVQNNKQVISALKRKSIEGINDLRPQDNNNRINARWTNDELLLAVQG